MIAMALLPQPHLVIADEPTTALDVTIQAQILKLLKRLAKDRGISVLLTTHDLGTAYEICDDITVMYAGQEVETAPVDEFFAVRAIPTPRACSRACRVRGASSRDRRRDPGADRPPTGCRFHPRCARATDACRTRASARHGARRRARGALLSPDRCEAAPA